MNPNHYHNLIPELNMHNTCTICLEEIQERNSTILPCGHSFHYNCINIWNRDHNSCPFCRSQILEDEEYLAYNNLNDDGGDDEEAEAEAEGIGPDNLDILDQEINIIPNIIDNNIINNNNQIINNFINNIGNENQDNNYNQQFENDINNIINILNNIANNIPNENNILYQNVRFLAEYMPRLNNNLEVNVYCNDCNTYICDCESCGERMCECENPHYINSINPFYHQNIENMSRTCNACFNNREHILVTFLVDNPNINIRENNFIRTHYINYYVNHNPNNQNNNLRSFNNFEDFEQYIFDHQNMINNWNGILENININMIENDIMNYLFENQNNDQNDNNHLNMYENNNQMVNIYDNMVS